jgi:hypothetical protein
MNAAMRRYDAACAEKVWSVRRGLFPRAANFFDRMNLPSFRVRSFSFAE